MWKRSVVPLAALACGLVRALAGCDGFDEAASPTAFEDGGPDVGPDGAGPEDGGADTGPPKSCTDDQPFATVAEVELSQSFLTYPRLSPDEKTIYVERAGRLYFAHRPSLTEKFDALVELLVDSDAGMTAPSIEGMGLGLYFSAGPFSNHDVLRATRSDLMSPFLSSVVLGSAINTFQDDVDPYVLPNGGALYFATGSFSEHKIFRAPLAGSVPGAATEVPGLLPESGSSNDVAPVVSNDERTIFFASSRNTGGSSTVHIFTAVRQSPSMPFGEAQELTQLNASSEHPGTLSEDRCRLYFDRSSGVGQAVFVASRTPR